MTDEMENMEQQDEGMESVEEREEREQQEERSEQARGWETGTPVDEGTVFIETGRGNTVEVPVGAGFAETIERIAEQANYGRFFRVFLNSSEILDPAEAPAKIEKDMRIVLTTYDKVGNDCLW